MLKAVSSKMESYEANFPSLSSRNNENYAKDPPDQSNPTKRSQALERCPGVLYLGPVILTLNRETESQTVLWFS